MGTGQVDIFDIRNVIGIFNLRIQEIQTFNQDFFTRFYRSQKWQIRMPAVMSNFRLFCQRNPRFNFNMLHGLSPYVEVE